LLYFAGIQKNSAFLVEGNRGAPSGAWPADVRERIRDFPPLEPTETALQK
jgi:hypothetical protein